METLYFMPPMGLTLTGIATLTTIYYLSAKKVLKNF